MRWGRAGLLVVLLLGTYFIAPFGQSDDPLPLYASALLAAGAIVAMALLFRRRIIQMIEDPALIDLPALAVLLAVTIVLFAMAYFMLDRSDAGQVAGLDTRLDSLYMTLSTVTTVGFGDIYPAGQTGRAVACLQLVFNAVFLGALVRTVGAGLARSQR